ncbi:unnamed protein product [Rhizoctonia solani]|uniref:Mitochondrial inner membrane protease subunit 2 n=1 Tax=Rhizoctonia solani TaxID=456999 RepID=A0A8H3A6Y3_9AGAM|nr:unnamed protein product [Rhizoctonia solani]
MSRHRELLQLLWIIPPTLTFTSLVGTINVVSGSSMQPSLNPEGPNQRDIVVVDRWSIVARHRYRRGDVVSLRSPVNPDLVIVKRILALGGDTIQTLPPYPDKQVRVPDGYAWVEGDEPFRSRDSNHFGAVPLGLIESRIALVLWPFKRLGPVPPRVETRRVEVESLREKRRRLMINPTE